MLVCFKVEIFNRWDESTHPVELNHSDELTRRQELPVAIKITKVRSSQASSYTVESKGRQMKQCRIKYFLKTCLFLG
jgi:hypothetical protein